MLVFVHLAAARGRVANGAPGGVHGARPIGSAWTVKPKDGSEAPATRPRASETLGETT